MPACFSRHFIYFCRRKYLQGHELYEAFADMLLRAREANIFDNARDFAYIRLYFFAARLRI